VPDRQFSEPELAALYDAFCPWDERGDLDFYLPLVMSADAVLDVGCGTGALLHRARESGHRGWLVGLDPAVGMLEQARSRTDIEWVQGDLSAVEWDHDFELIVMTGHAFQVLLEDNDLRVALAAIRRALTENGHFIFETRNPLVREWERWTPENAVEKTDNRGAVVTMSHEVEAFHGERVSFTTTYTHADWDRPEVSHSTLRFLDAGSLSTFLADAGLTIEEQFGDWDRAPFVRASPEIITIATRT
jgi:ubiquinone/menaquinone biosynthesis C-methylase UbiE